MRSRTLAQAWEDNRRPRPCDEPMGCCGRYPEVRRSWASRLQAYGYGHPRSARGADDPSYGVAVADGIGYRLPGPGCRHRSHITTPWSRKWRIAGVEERSLLDVRRHSPREPR